MVPTRVTAPWVPRCVPCSPLVADLLGALHEVERLSGDARVRRIARAAPDGAEADPG